VVKIEVASIKPCKDGTAAARGGRNPNGGISAASLVMNCRTVKSLIESAYASGMPLLPPIEGGPDWIDSDRYRYTINVKAEGAGSGAATRAPILRALLEDRFQLKTHRETREVSGYALTVAKGGPKLKPFQEGNCVDIGVVKPLSKAPPPHEPGERPALCGVNRAKKGDGPNVTWDIPGTSLDFLARTFLGIAFGDRPVFDRTGIDGLFDIHLEFTPDESTPGPAGGFRPATPVDSGTPAPAGPSIFTALQQQLGLKLEAARGPREVLVIDRVEKPSEN